MCSFRQRNRLAYLKYQKERIRDFNESMLDSGIASINKSCEAANQRCCSRGLVARIFSLCGSAFCARAVNSLCCCSGGAAAAEEAGGGCGVFRMCASGGGWWTCVPPGVSRSSGRYLSVVYLVTKTLYAANLVGQLYFMGRFLTTGGHSFAASSSSTSSSSSSSFRNDSVAAAALSLLGNHSYILYGALVLRDLYNGVEWHESSLFPRITWCDFQIGGVGQPITHTVNYSCPYSFVFRKPNS